MAWKKADDITPTSPPARVVRRSATSSLKKAFSFVGSNGLFTSASAMRSNQNAFSGYPLVKRRVGLQSTCTVLLAVALVAGCSSSASWDKEYACSGQEQVISSFLGNVPPRPSARNTPSLSTSTCAPENALVKTYMTKVDSTANQVTWFQRQESVVVDQRPVRPAHQRTDGDRRKNTDACGPGPAGPDLRPLRLPSPLPFRGQP